MAQVRPLQRETPAGGRVPPHNLEAEESVLGSMLLSKTAVGEALEIIRPEDFYRDAHVLICEVVRDLFAQGEPVDAITAAEELRRRGVLEDVGGGPYIYTLVSSVPTAANAVFYARIVSEHAVLRRLIDAATAIAQESYEVPEDVEGMVNRAEELVFAVAQRRIHQDFRPIRDLLAESMEHLERLHERQGDVTGLPTGFSDLDHILSGLQPGNLILIAARPAMGKSSFAMNVAQHVAQIEQRGAVMFSLEMSWMEIVQRMICAEARIDTGKIRTGKMNEAEWRRVSTAVGRLAEAPLFIDDTPSISMGEIRAKCRRLKSRGDLGLVVVDYLQLMTSPRRTENRVQEVSEISRSMKILAKELEVPVLAVSQLSRQPEQGGGGSKPRRPRLADLRECVTGDTLVCLADGRRAPIRDLVGTTPAVVAVDQRGRVVEAQSDLVWSVGRKLVLRVRLASGREIRATGKHRLLGAPGWIRLRDLAVGARIACARELPEPPTTEHRPEDHLVLLAHLIGDGSYLSHQPLRYTTASEENSDAVRGAAERAFGSRVTRHAGRGRWHQLVIAGNGNRWHPAGVNRWLRDLGIFDQRSAAKRVPDGIRSRMTAIPNAARPSLYHVTVSGAAMQRRFLERVGAFGPRVAPATSLVACLERVTENTNVDTLPVEFFERVKQRRRERGVSQRRMAALRGTSYGGASHFAFSPSRGVLVEYGTLLQDEVLLSHARSDLFWDKVVSIEPDGEEEVFDLTVPGPSSWLADGIVSHNSGALEQDADVVMFVYREDVYDRESEKKGEAEIIIEKHRNGPTGTVDLAFLGQYTKFENLARG